MASVSCGRLDRQSFGSRSSMVFTIVFTLHKTIKANGTSLLNPKQFTQATQEIMKIGKEMFNRWNKYAQLLVAEHGRTIEDVTSKVTAWNIANKLNIPSEAYHVGCNDSHIETALKRIFPMAWD